MFSNATIVGSLITALLVFLGSIIVPFVTKRLNKVSDAVEVADRLSANAEKNSDIALRIAETVDKKLAKTEERLETTEKRCFKCIDDLNQVRAALRTIVRVLDSDDPTGIEAAVAAARSLI